MGNHEHPVHKQSSLDVYMQHGHGFAAALYQNLWTLLHSQSNGGMYYHICMKGDLRCGRMSVSVLLKEIWHANFFMQG